MLGLDGAIRWNLNFTWGQNLLRGYRAGVQKGIQSFIGVSGWESSFDNMWKNFTKVSEIIKCSLLLNALDGCCEKRVIQIWNVINSKWGLWIPSLLRSIKLARPQAVKRYITPTTAAKNKLSFAFQSSETIPCFPSPRTARAQPSVWLRMYDRQHNGDRNPQVYMQQPGRCRHRLPHL